MGECELVSRRKKQNVMIVVVSLVGIALIAIALWYFSQEYRSHKYHNDSGRFSIKYPAAWSYEEDKNGAAVIFYTPKENDLDDFIESVNVVVQNISANPMTLKKYSEKALEQMDAVFGENMAIYESGVTFIAGQTGYKLVFTGKTAESELRYMVVFLIKGVTVYQVTYTSLSSQYDLYLSKVNRMLKSFQLD